MKYSYNIIHPPGHFSSLSTSLALFNALHQLILIQTHACHELHIGSSPVSSSPRVGFVNVDLALPQHQRQSQIQQFPGFKNVQFMPLKMRGILWDAIPPGSVFDLSAGDA